MKLEFFDPAHFEPITKLCAEKAIPLSARTVRELCRTKKFPAVKVGNDWMTTRTAIRAHFYKKANAAMKRITV